MLRHLLSGAVIVAASVSPVLAADLIIEEEVIVPVEDVFDWTGFYVGVKGGWAAGEADFDFTDVGTGVDVPLDGWLLGAVAGGGVQMDMFYLGAEGEVSFAHLSGTTPCPNPAFDCDVSANWIADIEGQVGFAADQVLFYLHGGLAAVNTTAATGFALGSVTNTAVGFVAGAGVKVAVTENVHVVGEYSYYDVSMTVPAGDLDPSTVVVHPRFHAVTLGVNVGF